MKHLFVICGMVVLLGGCYYDNLEELHPALPPCDTSHTISFANEILPIFTQSCGNRDNNCHINDGTSNGYGLANYVDVKNTIIGSGRFMQVITHDPSIPSSKWMPYLSSAKLDDCSIQKIEIWLRDTLNN